jgi:chromosome segregation ATPase
MSLSELSDAALTEKLLTCSKDELVGRVVKFNTTRKHDRQTIRELENELLKQKEEFLLLLELKKALQDEKDTIALRCTKLEIRLKQFIHERRERARQEQQLQQQSQSQNGIDNGNVQYDENKNNSKFEQEPDVVNVAATQLISAAKDLTHDFQSWWWGGSNEDKKPTTQLRPEPASAVVVNTTDTPKRSEQRREKKRVENNNRDELSIFQTPPVSVTPSFDDLLSLTGTTTPANTASSIITPSQFDSFLSPQKSPQKSPQNVHNNNNNNNNPNTHNTLDLFSAFDDNNLRKPSDASQSDECTSLQDRFSSVEGKLSTLNGEIEQMKHDHRIELQKKDSECNDKIAQKDLECNDTIANLKQEFKIKWDVNESQFNSLNDLLAQSNDHTEGLQSLLQRERDERAEYFDRKQTEIENLHEEILRLEEIIEEYKGGVGNDNTTNNITTQTTNLTQNNHSQEEYNTLFENYTELKGEYSVLQETVNDFGRKNTDLNEQSALQKRIISSLQTRNADFEFEVEKRLRNCLAQNEYYEHQVSRLYSERDYAHKSLKFAHRHIEELNSCIRESQSTKTSQEGEDRESETTTQQMSITMANLNKNLNYIQEQYDQLHHKYTNLESLEEEYKQLELSNKELSLKCEELNKLTQNFQQISSTQNSTQNSPQNSPQNVDNIEQAEQIEQIEKLNVELKNQVENLQTQIKTEKGDKMKAKNESFRLKIDLDTLQEQFDSLHYQYTELQMVNQQFKERENLNHNNNSQNNIIQNNSQTDEFEGAGDDDNNDGEFFGFGELDFGDGSDNIGQHDDKEQNSSNFTQKNISNNDNTIEIDNLKLQIAEKETKIHNLELEIEQSTSTNSQRNNQQLLSLQDKLDKLTLSYDDINDKYSKSLQNEQNNRIEIETLKNKNDQFVQHISQLEINIDNLSLELTKLDQLSKLENTLQDNKDELIRTKDELAQMVNRIEIEKQNKIQIENNFQTEKQHFESNLSSLQEQNSQLMVQFDEYQTKSNLLNEQYTLLKTQYNELGNSMSELLHSNTILENNNKNLILTNQNQSKELLQNNEKFTHLNQELKTLSSELYQLQSISNNTNKTTVDRINELEEHIDKLLIELNTITLEKEHLTNSYQIISNQHDDYISTTQIQIDNYINTITNLQQELGLIGNDLVDKINQKDLEYGKLTTQYDELGHKYNELGDLYSTQVQLYNDENVQKVEIENLLRQQIEKYNSLLNDLNLLSNQKNELLDKCTQIEKKLSQCEFETSTQSSLSMTEFAILSSSITRLMITNCDDFDILFPHICTLLKLNPIMIKTQREEYISKRSLAAVTATTWSSWMTAGTDFLNNTINNLQQQNENLHNNNNNTDGGSSPNNSQNSPHRTTGTK